MRAQITKFRLISALLLIATGITVLIGWKFEIAIFKSIFPGYVTMKPVSAVCFILAGFYLFLRNKAKSSNVITLFIRICALLITLTGFLALLEFVFGNELYVNNILFSKQLLNTVEKDIHYISPIAAFNYIILGISFFLLSFKSIFLKSFQFLAVIVFTTSVFAFSNIYGEEDFYGIINNSKMAIHSSLAFILISICIITFHPDKGLFSLFTSNTIGGLLSRKIIPFLLVLPVFMNWLKHQDANYGLFSALFGIFLFCIALYYSYNLIQVELKKQDYEKKLLRHAQVLEQNNIQLTDFCNIISHNLRAPFVNISMLVDFVEKTNDEEERKEIISKFRPVLSNINETFNELVESIQIRNDLQPTMDQVDLNESIAKIISGFELDIKKAKAEIELLINDTPIIEFPKKYIDSIFFNLISNAIKYKSPDRKPKIVIKTENKHDSILISVTDNGLGIDLNKHKDSLFKIRKVFHDHPDSKGFGLYMTKSQLDAMGSKIWVDSLPDVGSTFYVEINKFPKLHEQN